MGQGQSGMNIQELAKCCGSSANVPLASSSEMDLHDDGKVATEPVRKDQTAEGADSEAPQTSQPESAPAADPQENENKEAATENNKEESGPAQAQEAPAEQQAASGEEAQKAPESELQAQNPEEKSDKKEEAVAVKEDAKEEVLVGLPEANGVEDEVTKYFASTECAIAGQDKNNADIYRAISALEPFNWTQLSLKENPQRALQGIQVDDQKNLYEGEWIGEEKNGRGIQIQVNGTRYDGFWKKNRYEGYGRLVRETGDVYVGQFHNDAQHGHGKMNWADKTSYEGQFVNKQLSGLGTYKWVDGRAYTGEWKDNLMNGKGTFTWANGNKYVGDFNNDKKDGSGIFTWPDGRVYNGEWKQGKQHGKGEYIHKNGQARKGTWIEGKRQNWIKDEVNNALMEFVKAQQAIQLLKTTLLKLLQEDAVEKGLKVDENKWVKFNDVLYESSILELNTTAQKIERACDQSGNPKRLEISIINGEQMIRAAADHKF